MSAKRYIFMSTRIFGDDLATVNRVLSDYGLPQRAEPGTLESIVNDFLPMSVRRAARLLRALAEALGDDDDDLSAQSDGNGGTVL